MTERDDFDIDGYSIEHHKRDDRVLIVTFPSAAPTRAVSPRDDIAWGRGFIAKRGHSALHVKTNRNCWYRRPQLLSEFKRLRDRGIFDGYRRVVTYGGSMGGYGALAYAGICGATHVLSLNPQTQLGPTVRDWENRFREADMQDWESPNLNINTSISEVEKLVTVHDPYDSGDSRHISMLSHPNHLTLHIPFVGHRVPVHLQRMGHLSWLFDAMIEDRLNATDFYQRMRSRRDLEVWKNNILSRAGQSNLRKKIILSYSNSLTG